MFPKSLTPGGDTRVDEAFVLESVGSFVVRCQKSHCADTLLELNYSVLLPLLREEACSTCSDGSDFDPFKVSRSPMRSALVIAALLSPLTNGVAVAVAASAPGSLESARADIRLKRFDAGLLTLKRLAQNGDSESQFLFGMAALNGLAREPDEPEARRYLTLAADQAHPAAAFVLASLLERDVPPDAARIHALLERAAQGGNAAAQEAIKRAGAILASDHEAAARDAHLRSELVLWAARHNEPELISRLLPTVDVQDEFGTSALAYAAQSGATNSIARLLQQGAHTNARNRYGVTPLMQAVGGKQLAAAEQLLAAGADVTAVDGAGNTPLIYAARADSAEAVELLLSRGANLNALNKDSYSALDEALIVDAAQAATVLRAHGATHKVTASVTMDHAADYSRTGTLYKGWTPLLVAISRDDVAEVNRLLDAGISAGAGSNARAPIVVAVQSGALKSAVALLKRGADAGAVTEHGVTSLGSAVLQGSVGMVAELLRAGALPDAHARKQAPPLLVAVQSGNQAIVQLLLGAHATLDATDEQGRTALMSAAQRGHAAIVSQLLAAGANAAMANHEGRSALWLAANAGRDAVLPLLLAAAGPHADVDRQGVTALMAAAAHGHAAVVAALVEAGVDKSTRSRDGNTALILAAGAGRLEVVKLLLAPAERLNVQNNLGDTALIAASRSGQLETCRLLLKAGADPSLRNADRATASDIARLRGLTEIKTLLDAA